MKKFSFKFLPILLAYFTLCNEINCCGGSNDIGFHNRVARIRVALIRGPHNRGPPNRGTPHHGPPQRGSPAHPPPNRCHQDEQNQTMIDINFMYESGTVKAGDQLECKLVNVIETSVDVQNSRKCNTHIFKQSDNQLSYVYVPASNNSKCFSFQVRPNNRTIRINFSNTPSLTNFCQVQITPYGKTYIVNKVQTTLKSAPNPIDISNNENLHSFWVRYDNDLVELGYGNSTVPYISYQMQDKDGFPSPVSYIGIMNQFKDSEYIIDADPVCGGINNRTETPTKTEPQVKTVKRMKTVCKVKN